MIVSKYSTIYSQLHAKDTGNVRSNIMCTYSQSRASKEVSKTYHMYLLIVTCNKINELTCSVRNSLALYSAGPRQRCATLALPRLGSFPGSLPGLERGQLRPRQLVKTMRKNERRGDTITHWDVVIALQLIPFIWTSLSTAAWSG